MRRAVAPRFAHVVRSCDDGARWVDEHGADGNLARIEGSLRLLERFLHEARVIQHE